MTNAPDDIIRRGYAAKKPSKVIAAEIGPEWSPERVRTRAQRMGVSGLRPTYAVTHRHRVSEKPKPVAAAEVPKAKVSERHRCKWPTAGEGMHTEFCGCPSLIRADGATAPYCPEHYERAYQRKGAPQ